MISDGIHDLLHGGFIFVITSFQYLFLNSSVVAHSLTGFCHFGLFGSND
jgi:hypothetical protein